MNKPACTDSEVPRGKVMLKTMAMPADANPSGDIFGGWLLAQMDLAGGCACAERAKGRVTTVAVNAMSFQKPVYVGDEVTCYCEITHVGRTSMTVQVETWQRNFKSMESTKVTEGTFIFVALDDNRQPRPVDAS